MPKFFLYLLFFPALITAKCANLTCQLTNIGLWGGDEKNSGRIKLNTFAGGQPRVIYGVLSLGDFAKKTAPRDTESTLGAESAKIWATAFRIIYGNARTYPAHVMLATLSLKRRVRNFELLPSQTR